jgi:hypothetical protein
MIRDLKKLYVAVLDNKVILFDTNLKNFIASMKQIEPSVKSYSYYSKKFKNENTVGINDNKNVKTYWLQQLV